MQHLGEVLINRLSLIKELHIRRESSRASRYKKALFLVTKGGGFSGADSAGSFCSLGVMRISTVSSRPKSNGRAERVNRTLKDGICSMLAAPRVRHMYNWHMYNIPFSAFWLRSSVELARTIYIHRIWPYIW